MFDKDYWGNVYIPWWQVLLLIVAVLGVLAAIIAVISAVEKKRENRFELKTRDLTYGAVCIAASFALSYVKFFSLPSGGSITAASVLPMLLYSYYFGFRKGLIVSSVSTLLQLVQGPYIVSPWSALLDYFVPYLAPALAGLLPFNRNTYNAVAAKGKNPLCAHARFFIGSGVYMVVRLFSHVLAGVLFWANGIDFLGWTGDLVGATAWGYSLTYNVLFLVPDTAVALAAGAVLLASKAFNRFMTASTDALQNADARSKNKEGTAAGADERQG